MKSIKYQVLSIMGIFVLYLLLTTYYLLPVHAVDSTPSADIRAKLEELKKEIASKAAKLKQEVNRKLQNKAYVGNVKSKSNTSITLSARSGPKIVSLNQDTVFEAQVKGKKYSQKLISEEDFVASLGDVDETGVLIAKKIILLNPTSDLRRQAPLIPSTLSPKSYLWGQIIAISDTLITLRDKGLKNVAVSLPSDNVKLNDFVILTGYIGKNDIFEAEFVYVIPQGGILKPKRIATPSAQISTKSAKPSPKSPKLP